MRRPCSRKSSMACGQKQPLRRRIATVALPHPKYRRQVCVYTCVGLGIGVGVGVGECVRGCGYGCVCVCLCVCGWDVGSGVRIDQKITCITTNKQMMLYCAARSFCLSLSLSFCLSLFFCLSSIPFPCIHMYVYICAHRFI